MAKSHDKSANVLRQVQGFFALVLLLLSAAIITPTSAFAQLAETQRVIGAVGKLNVPAKLLSESEAVVPGKTLTLAFLFQPKKGWHGYWENPGDAGVGMTLKWDLPDGVTAGKPQYPVPETLLIAGLMNYVYEGQHAVLVDLQLSESVNPNVVLPISVRADWLSCTDEICVPEGDDLSVTLMSASESSAGSDARNPQFDQFRSQLARPLGSEAVFQVKDDRFQIAIPYPATAKIEKPYFFSATDGIVEYAAKQIFRRDGDMIIMGTGAVGELDTLEGIFKIGEHEGFVLKAKKGEVTSGGVVIGGEASNGAGSSGQSSGVMTMLAALGGAIVGGFLLNIMPCVFPILSLKAISIAKSGGDKKTVQKDALAYSAGIILTCLALGALMLALRAAGQEIGWAFQLQSPVIVLLLLILVSGIALNLAGLFELPALTFGSKLTAASGASGSFWTGVLAAFVATPCTGPFMAAAMGAALFLSPPLALLIFAGLGLGLALPFLLIAYVPALRGRMPKPGPWMETFRKVMSVPMFLTVAALAWVLGQQSGVDGLGFAILMSIAVALLLWWIGQNQRSGKAIWVPAGGALASSLAAMFTIGGMVPNAVPAGAVASKGIAVPFDQQRLAQLRAENRPVFAYFTADWCITCKANEKVALERSETHELFKSRNVTVMVGDWTRPNPEITRFLSQHGRSGVPLYLYYAPGKEAVVLPQILTTSIVADIVQKG